MKKLSLLFALMCASMMSFAAIDWSGYEWLGNGSGNDAYTNKFKVAPAEGQTVVNLQKPGWAAEAGIYTHFKAGVTSCSLPEGKYAIDGAGVCLYLSAFTAKETEVTVVDALGSYTFTVYYEDGTAGGGNEGGNTDDPIDPNPSLTAPTTAAPAPTWPASQVAAIYAPTYNANCGFGDWGSGTVMTETEFGKKFVTTNLGYFGLVDFALNCLTMEKMHLDLWIAADASIRVVPIWGGKEQGITINLKGQQWNSIDIALTDFNEITNWGNVYQVKIDNAANLTFWLGNVFFYRETALEDTEKPTNVTASVAGASYFTVTLALSAQDNMGVVNYSVLNGENVVATGAGESGATVNVTVPNLTPNTEYTFSVITTDTKGNAADAVTVAAKTVAAPAAAPAPELTGKTVVPVYTDAVEGGPFINIGGWGQSTVVTNGQLAEGDNVMFLTNMNYLGWELNPAVNATDMEYLHVDFYSPDMTGVSITPISPGKEGVYNVALEANKWVSVEIPLSHYATIGIEWNNVFQFKFFNAAPAGSSLFIDNVYFYEVESGAGIEDIQSEVSARKVMENGVVYIIRDGVRYTTFGQKVK